MHIDQMLENKKMEKAKEFFKKNYANWGLSTPPVLHFVLGSLFGKRLSDVNPSFQGWKKIGCIDFDKVPGLVQAKAPYHISQYIYFLHIKSSLSVCFQLGRLHGYEGLTPQEVVTPVSGPLQAGTKNFILSNISGSLNPKLMPGDVISITDHINWTGKSPLTLNKTEPVFNQALFTDMTNTYDSSLRALMEKCLKKNRLPVTPGVYVGLPGPQYETPAEVKMLRLLGGDAVGMSTIWEAIFLHHLKAKICSISLITNKGAGLNKKDSPIQVRVETLQSSLDSTLLSFIDFANMFIKNYSK